MSNYEHRQKMWLFLSKLFEVEDELDFIWMFSEEDMKVVNQDTNVGQVAGVVKGIS